MLSGAQGWKIMSDMRYRAVVLADLHSATCVLDGTCEATLVEGMRDLLSTLLHLIARCILSEGSDDGDDVSHVLLGEFNESTFSTKFSNHP